MRRGAWFIVGGLIVVGIALVALRRADPPPVAPIERGDAGTDAAPPEAGSATSDPARAVAPGDTGAQRAAAAPGAPTTAALPLPPPDTSIANLLPDLERRARAGDARAACRLAGELGRCATLARRLAAANQPQHAMGQPGAAQADPTQVDHYVDFAARQQIELERDQALCAGVPIERFRDATPWLFAAARGGSAAARVAFASGAWTVADPYAMRHADVLAAYSREAERMALASVEDGAPEMVRMLGMAYAGRETHHALGAVVDPDPVRAHALLRLLLDRRPAGTSDAPPAPNVNVGAQAQRLPEQRAFEDVDARLDPGQRAASDAMFTRLAARRAEYQARQVPRARTTGFVNSVVQPEACDR